MVDIESIIGSMSWESFLKRIEEDEIWRGAYEVLGILFDSYLV